MTNIVRSPLVAILLSFACVALTSAINLPNRWRSLTPPSPARQFSLADRVAYQRAIEEVYWRHRIWPKERPDPKPSLDAVMPAEQIEKKVKDYLRDSQLLKDQWQRPITPGELQAEMERMASHTKQSEVLREIFAALGDDPFVIAECLARPVLAERLLTEFYSHDPRSDGELRQRVESGRGRADNQLPKLMVTATGNYTLPPTSDGTNECIDDTWRATAGPLSSRDSHTAVWTGSEMIVWGGLSQGNLLNTGWRYNPATDSWRVTSFANAPSARRLHTAVWTGSEMIVWGGYDGINSVNTGGRYSPSTDTWTAMGIANAPLARSLHTAVWTGSEMIVWGGTFYDGSSHYLNTGGRYSPSTDSWIATSTTNVPSARSSHTAVWTGSEMIVWGGVACGNYSCLLNTGGRYNPSTDSWTATSTTSAPTGRADSTTVWTGGEMIVWGGYYNGNDLSTGGRYNPSTDSWTVTSIANAPLARSLHTAVWTGSEMIVWGGFDSNSNRLNTGGRYNPSTDSWTATSTTNAPTGRNADTALWAGNEMIVWGGVSAGNSVNTGGRYNPTADSWITTSTASAPTGRYYHTAVWTGSEMIVWGGTDESGAQNTGARYNPSTDSWTTITTANAPTARAVHTAVWTGSEMIIWGGGGGGARLNTGGRYNPSTDSWMATSTINAPSARSVYTAIWTGNELIVWGGYDGSNELNTGGKYSPSTDSWTATSTINAPSARYEHTAVWTGSEMIVWGGTFYDGTTHYFNTGGRYNPSTDSWTATSTSNAPIARESHTAVWAGNEMIVWGGYDGSNDLDTGGRYNPTTDSWTATSTANAPFARDLHTAVWTGSEMIVWGGIGAVYTNAGGRYNPAIDSWTATSTTDAASPRYYHTAVWTGNEMIVWGGLHFPDDLNTGGRYCAPSQAPVVQSAFSRGIHGAAGTFDIPLPLTGPTGVECRTTGGTNDYTTVVTFAANVTVTGSPQAQVALGTGCVGSGGVCNGNVSVNGNIVTVPLTNISNAQTINVRINGVNSAADTPATDFTIPMSVLIGDTNANGTVNAADVAQTKGHLGQTLDATNFRSDVNANGTINAGDVSIIKSNLGTGLP